MKHQVGLMKGTRDELHRLRAVYLTASHLTKSTYLYFLFAQASIFALGDIEKFNLAAAALQKANPVIRIIPQDKTIDPASYM